MGVAEMWYPPIYCTSCVLFQTREFGQGIPFCASGNCEASPTGVKRVGMMSVIAFSEAAWSVSDLQTWFPSKMQTRNGKDIPARVLFLDTSVQVKSRGDFDFSCPMGCEDSHPEHGAQGDGTFTFQVWTEQRSELMQKLSFELKLWGCWYPIKGRFEGHTQSVCTTVLEGKTV